jgi:hypothetical protein
MNTIVRAVQLVWLAMWPVLGALAFLLFVSTSLGPRDPQLAGLWPAVLILGGAVLIWLGLVARQWLRFRELGVFSVADTSLSPVPLPDGLAHAETELQRLGFASIGQYTVETAWPEGPTRVYATYVSPKGTGLWADISYATSRTTFSSYWANGAVLETTCTPDGATPKADGALPGWLLIQSSGDDIEAAHRLHLASLARYEPVGGAPLPVPDLPAAIELLADGMRRIHEFHRTQLWFPLAQTLFIVPAWLGLAWFVISG